MDMGKQKWRQVGFIICFLFKIFINDNLEVIFVNSKRILPIQTDVQLTYHDHPRKVESFNLIPCLVRYSGGRRGGGSLPKAAVAAWGGYQVYPAITFEISKLVLQYFSKYLSTDWNSNGEVWRLGSWTRRMELWSMV